MNPRDWKDMNFAGTAVDNIRESPEKLRAAISARFSDENQDESSNDDQIRECRDAAEQNGWVVLEEFIRRDSAKTGKTLAGRDGLKELVELAGQKPRPYDVLIFYSTSRYGRNLSDTLPLIDELLFYEVQLYFVDCRLSSTDPNFRDRYISRGRNDEQFLEQLGSNVKRGQRGRVLAGYIGSSRVFGYDNVPVEHPTKKERFGRPYVIGVEHVINPEEATVVIRIFEMRASGIGCLEIARTLNREGVLSPLAKLGTRPRSWSATTVLRILENEKYIGKNIWNRTKQAMNPKTGRINKKPRPRSEWEIVEKPKWRIVSDELWASVQYQLKRTDIDGRRRGGLNRSRTSRSYIFSGIPKCAVCGGNFTVVSGGPDRVRYGCYRHRFKGTCKMATVIPKVQLEKQLLDALAQNLGDPNLRAEISRSFREQLQKALDAHQKAVGHAARKHGDLNQARAALMARRENLFDAIEQYGMSGALQSRFEKLEAELREIDLLLSAP